MRTRWLDDPMDAPKGKDFHQKVVALSVVIWFSDAPVYFFRSLWP